MFGGRFFEPNLRSVGKAGVDFVMDSFFADLEAKFGAPSKAESAAPLKSHLLNPLGFFKQRSDKSQPAGAKDEDVVCEEQLLEAFGKQP